MTNGLKKSDEAVRPVRAANKGARACAESPEERASTEGNPERQSTRRTQRRASVTQVADRIRQAAERNPKERLTALFHHITPEVLHRAYFALKRNVAAGIDGVTWDMYGEGLEERLLDLHRRLHSGGAYRAPPVRRVEIPKPDGGTRPLGVAALEDKIVQKAVVDVILTPIYEVEFLGFSYGFRPGQGAHDALDALAFGIERRKVSPDYVPSSSCSIDRVDCAVGSVQRAPNRAEWAARRHVSGPNPVPVPVWSLEHEVRT